MTFIIFIIFLLTIHAILNSDKLQNRYLDIISILQFTTLPWTLSTHSTNIFTTIVQVISIALSGLLIIGYGYYLFSRINNKISGHLIIKLFTYLQTKNIQFISTINKLFAAKTTLGGHDE